MSPGRLPVRVVLVDDQELVRSGLQMVLESRADVEVVGDAADGRAALDLLATTPADVVLMDVRMPRMNGLEAVRALRDRDDLRVLVLTTFDEDDHVLEALRSGASGFLVKDSPIDELVAAIHHVHDGAAVISPVTTRRLLDRALASPRIEGSLSASGRATVLDRLTPREREVLGLVAEGQSNAEIARTLTLGEVTVKTHVGHILAKLDLRDRVQAVILAYETGLVGPLRGSS